MTSTRSLVSIIIPCYNYGQYLAEAIESALTQTHPHIEVIVVDDGSTDDTQVVAKQYPARLITQRNQGQSASTNNGVRASSGEFVVRLDGDDVLYPSFVAETLAALQDNPDASLAHADAEFFGTRSGRVPFAPFELEALAQGAYVSCTSLFRRSAWDAVGGLAEDMILCEDWDLGLTFAERGMRGVMVPKILWGYRQHGQSRVNRRILSLTGIRREYTLISQLQDRHPRIFSPDNLVRRLVAAPYAVARGRMSMRVATRLFGFYGIMLFRFWLGVHVARMRTPAASAEQVRTPPIESAL